MIGIHSDVPHAPVARGPHAWPIRTAIALTPFTALCGFRTPRRAAGILEGLGTDLTDRLHSLLVENPTAHGMRAAFRTLISTSMRPEAAAVDEVVARQVVAVLRRGEGARSSGLDETGAHSDPVVVAAVLREAALSGHGVWIGYADEVGGVSTHLVHPESVEAGRVRATVGDGDALRTFLLHRVTKVREAD